MNSKSFSDSERANLIYVEDFLYQLITSGQLKGVRIKFDIK